MKHLLHTEVNHVAYYKKKKSTVSTFQYSKTPRKVSSKKLKYALSIKNKICISGKDST